MMWQSAFHIQSKWTHFWSYEWYKCEITSTNLKYWHALKSKIMHVINVPQNIPETLFLVCKVLIYPTIRPLRPDHENIKKFIFIREAQLHNTIRYCRCEKRYLYKQIVFLLKNTIVKRSLMFRYKKKSTTNTCSKSSFIQSASVVTRLYRNHHIDLSFILNTTWWSLCFSTNLDAVLKSTFWELIPNIAKLLKTQTCFKSYKLKLLPIIPKALLNLFFNIIYEGKFVYWR